MIVELKLKEITKGEYPTATMLGGDGKVYKLLWLDENGVWHEVRTEGRDE